MPATSYLANEFRWRSRTSLVDNVVIVFSLPVVDSIGANAVVGAVLRPQIGAPPPARLVQKLNLNDTENELSPAEGMYETAMFQSMKEAPMAEGTYNQFCPIAMASEILGTRWTLLLVRELLSGSKRFNELRRGVQRMSPALLSKRLKDLEAAGIVARSKVTGEPALFEYQLTKAGLELAPVIDGVGAWGHRWIKTEASLKNLDVNLLMWGIRGSINAEPMPARRTTIQVIFRDLPKAQKNWWLIATPGEGIDLCSVDPGFDVDLYVSTDLR